MAIMKIKEKEEVGKFIETLSNEKGWNNSELGRRLGKEKGLPDGQAVPRDTISKWIRGELYPGVDNIYYLAQVFGVTMEYILMAGSQRERFDDRPFSLYAVAKSGDKERLEQLMHTENDYGSIIGENYDEFDKTIVDYLIEFKQVDLIKFMFEKGYLAVWGTQTNTAIRVGNLTQMEDKFNRFVELAIEKDDAELYNYLINRTRPILQKEEDCMVEAFQANQYRRDGYVFSREMIEKLLHAENILKSYMNSFLLTEKEWREWNSGILYYKDNRGRDLCKELERVPTLCVSFNLIMNYLLLKGRAEGEQLLDFAIEQKKQTEQYLRNVTYMGTPYPYRINEEGRVVADSYGYGCVAIVGVVLPSVYKTLTGKLKEKSKALFCDRSKTTKILQ